MDLRLPPDFKEFLSLLNEQGVRYLLIGGYAVGYHGYPRATGDMDIWVAREPENADRIVEVIRRFGFDLPELTPDLFLEGKRIVRMGRPPLRLEILTDISGVTFNECYSQRVTDTIDGVQVHLINLDQLKQNKLASGRPKDLSDLDNLRRI
jgi:hypothetical protein